MSYRYTPVAHHKDHDIEKSKARRPIKRRPITVMAIRSILLLVSWVLCIWIGFSLRDHFATRAGHIPVTFQYNSTYSKAPSLESDRAWAELFPVGEGFFRTASNEISAHSVFHQLRCLNTLRQVTYDLLNRSSSAYSGRRDDAEVKRATDHALYCFDYLRQNIQCTADDTLEKMVPELGGVSGWDTVHYCKDFEMLKQKATRLMAQPLSAAHNP